MNGKTSKSSFFSEVFFLRKAQIDKRKRKKKRELSSLLLANHPYNRSNDYNDY